MAIFCILVFIVLVKKGSYLISPIFRSKRISQNLSTLSGGISHLAMRKFLTRVSSYLNNEIVSSNLCRSCSMKTFIILMHI